MTEGLSGCPSAESSNLDQIISSLMAETLHREDEDPALGITKMGLLIDDLNSHFRQERHAYSLARETSVRGRLESLRNLIESLDSHMQTMRRIVSWTSLFRCWFLHHVLLCKTKDSIRSKLQLWLDEQQVLELSLILDTNHNDNEDAQVKALCLFQSIVHKGYNASIQETILLCGLITKFASLLEVKSVSWHLRIQVVSTIRSLIMFNKDIFVSLVLMAKVVKHILTLMDTEPDENKLVLLSVLKCMLSIGHTIVVDEIYSHDGISRIVNLLIDCKLEALQLAAFDFLLELVYNGRIEVVERMFECNVVKNLVILRSSYKETTGNPASSSSHGEKYGKHREAFPFVDALSIFATQIAVGIGLREREKRALREVFLRQIKEIIQDDVDVANISIKVLYGLV